MEPFPRRPRESTTNARALQTRAHYKRESTTNARALQTREHYKRESTTNAGKPVKVNDEMETLRKRLAEAEETLSAIRSGKADALIVDTPKGKQVYTLRGAE